MSEKIIYQRLVEICGKKNVSNDRDILTDYSKDLSFFPEKLPLHVVWAKNKDQVEKIVRFANELNFSIVPVSSSGGPRHHGDTIPHEDNTVILDLSKMKKILTIDRKNRVVMVEPGVTFGELIPTLRKKGLRLLFPLHPRENKSVLTCALEREPITIPRYHWDTSDPLLCTEVVFGTGDLFRTGTAAGPGTIEEQKKSGQAQLNPMGPTQFSPFRIVQGAQGSMGIITWATLKLELIPSLQKVFHLQSKNLEELLTLQHQLLKYRLCDELIVVNNLNLACLMKQEPQEILNLSKSLSKWNLIFVIAGRGKLASDKISYLEGDIEDILKEFKLNRMKSRNIIDEQEILNVLNHPTKNNWKIRLTGGYQDIFFISNQEKIPEYISIMDKHVSKNVGVYIQALN